MIDKICLLAIGAGAILTGSALENDKNVIVPFSVVLFAAVIILIKNHIKEVKDYRKEISNRNRSNKHNDASYPSCFSLYD